MTEHMYTELAAWWPLLSPVDEYEEEAELYREALILPHWVNDRHYPEAA
jgi:hypothetical protein